MFANHSQILVYIIFFISALIFAFLINGLLLKFSRTLGMRNQPDSMIRWSSQTKPSLGGITFYILFLLSLSVYPVIFEKSKFFFNQQYSGIILASSIGFLLGLFDDAYNTKPLIKFLTQILCGAILIATGTYITLFAHPWLNYALTLFWVIGMMNSINMLDNMDGITTTVSLSIIATIILDIILFNVLNNEYLLILIGVLAALASFLFYNWNPSKMYMGDTGSQFLGVLLAAVSIVFLWNFQVPDTIQGGLMQIVLVILAFALPIIDTTTVTIKRLLRGSSPFVGGKDHTTHHLVYAGLKDNQVALVFAGICLLNLILNLIIIFVIPQWNYWFALIFIFYFLLLFAVLFYIANKNKKTIIP